MNSMRSNLQFRIGGWETNPNMNLVIRTEDVLKRFERESIIHCTMNDEKKNSTEIETKILDKEKNSVMLFFYTWIKSIQMRRSQNKSIQMTQKSSIEMMTGVLHKAPMAVIVVDLLPNEMIEEAILIRLPVKVLMIMFKCNSKEWNGFMSDDNTPIGFLCGSKTNNYAVAKHSFLVANKFLYTSKSNADREEVDFLNTFGYVIAAFKDLLLLIHRLGGLTWFSYALFLHFAREQKKGSNSSSLGFVMLCFYIWIKSHHMTNSQKKSRQGLNKEPMNTLAVRAMPKEIIEEEIMIRLPVKTLMMFKCVSKDWNDFISDDYFRRRYISRQQHKGNAPAGFFCSNTTDYYAENLGFCFASKFLYISENYVKKEELESFDYLFGTFDYVIAASKGLLLLGYSSNYLSVYDFVSKKHVNLPRNNLPSRFNVALGFKCEKSNSGNHHLCYKVVCVDASSRCKYATRGSSYNVDIYSSETGTWRKSNMRSHLPFSMHSHSVSKVIGGVFHWPLHCLDWVVAYDSDNGTVALIELPSTVDTKFYGKIMRHFEVTKEGSLQFISIKDMAINVWTVKSTTGRSYMDEVLVHGSQWSLTSSVSLWDIGVDFIDFHFLQQNSSRIICADPVNLHIIYLDIAHQLFAYDCRQGKIVSTFSQEIEVKTDAFVHFEWPTWPCL